MLNIEFFRKDKVRQKRYIFSVFSNFLGFVSFEVSYLGMKMKIRIRLIRMVIDDKGSGIYFVFY